MEKIIHIFEGMSPEWVPQLPIGTFYARTSGEQWAVCQLEQRAVPMPFGQISPNIAERVISVHEKKEEAKRALIHLVLRNARKPTKPKVRDTKHYWLTPNEVMKPINAEFGANIFDPCPYPRPPGFNGLEVEWGEVNYVNPLFRKTDGVGISDWVRKMILEQGKGRASILVFPTYSWFHLLLNAGAEMWSLGQVHWLAIEDRTPQKASLPIVMFILRGKKKKKKK
jgi:hypothetical protein